jgi:hypothetical protein
MGLLEDNPDLKRPNKKDRVIAHQSDGQTLVGLTEVIGIKNGKFWLRPLERIGANMRELKKEHAIVARIPAYQPGDQHAIREISQKDAEMLLRLARASVAERPEVKRRVAWRRLSGALEDFAEAEEGKRFGQGFGLSAKERQVIELRAVAVATKKFKSAKWSVEYVGDRKPFDLVCRKSGAELHVEVKGTTGLGQRVILTKNEVDHARDYSSVALEVVHGIRLKKGKAPGATGGTLKRRDPWTIVAADLEPLAYYYQIGST